LVQDASWWFQQKFDGRRLAVQKADGQYSGINKLGQLIPIDSRLTKCLESVQAQAFLVDGEITDSRFHLWDLLDINGTDLRIQPYEIRYARLGLVFRGVDEALRVCETAMTPTAKRAFVKAMHESRAEGFVCKNRNAAYAGGRAGQHFKCKFVTTSSFIVGPKPAIKAADGHRSIGLYLLRKTASASWAPWEYRSATRFRAMGRSLRFDISTAIPEPTESSSKRSISARFVTT
jgi:ATP-dependent DNA ligase